MADRHTSAAKNVDGLHHEESTLDRALRLRDEFNRAHRPEEREKAEAQKAAPERPPDRSAVHTPAPGLHLKPPDGQVRRAVDKQIDDEKQNKLNERVRNLNDAYKSTNKDHSKDQDREL